MQQTIKPLTAETRHETPASCRGSLLLEIVVAVVLFALVGSAVLAGLSTAYTSGARTKTQSIAENLARNQLADVFSQPYLSPPASYPSITPPPGYGVTALAEEYVTGDSNLAKVVISVTRENDTVLVVETLRARD